MRRDASDLRHAGPAGATSQVVNPLTEDQRRHHVRRQLLRDRAQHVERRDPRRGAVARSVPSYRACRCAAPAGCVDGTRNDTGGTRHEDRHHDVSDGLRDPAARARRRGRGARLRIAVVPRAQPHSHQPQVAVAGRRRAAEMVLRHLRSLRGDGRRRRRHQDDQARHRRLPGGPARSHPHRQGSLDRRPPVATAACCSASAAAGTTRRWPTTAPPSARASS